MRVLILFLLCTFIILFNLSATNSINPINNKSDYLKALYNFKEQCHKDLSDLKKNRFSKLSKQEISTINLFFSKIEDMLLKIELQIADSYGKKSNILKNEELSNSMTIKEVFDKLSDVQKLITNICNEIKNNKNCDIFSLTKDFINTDFQPMILPSSTNTKGMRLYRYKQKSEMEEDQKLQAHKNTGSIQACYNSSSQEDDTVLN